MIWIHRLAILFAGFVVGGVAMNLYLLVCCFISVFALGITDTLFLAVQYWVCLIAGFATAVFLLRRAWPRSQS